MREVLMLNFHGIHVIYKYINGIFSYFIDGSKIDQVTLKVKYKIELFMIEAESVFVFEDFEDFILGGLPWNSCSGSELIKYKHLAINVIENNYNNFSPKKIKIAQNILTRINGNRVDSPKRQPNDVDIKKSNYKKQRSKLMHQLLERDGYKCMICLDSNSSELRIKHIISMSQGGESILSNLELRCKHCMNKNTKSKFTRILNNMDSSVAH